MKEISTGLLLRCHGYVMVAMVIVCNFTQFS